MKSSTTRFLLMLAALLVIIIALTIGFYLIINYESEGKPEQGPYVTDVIDGDTFKMSDGSTIRLLCVNTPEKAEEGYQRAKSFLESLVLNRNVRFIEGETLDKTDKYNRDLRFVYVQTSSGEIFVNQEIVRLGFGELYTYLDEEGECENTLII